MFHRWMRYYVLTVLVYAFGMAYLVANPAPPPKPFERSEIVADTIRAKEIHLKSKDGRCSIVLVAQDDKVGIWVTGPAGDAHLYAEENVSVLGVNTKHYDTVGTPAALVAERGEPFSHVQLCDRRRFRVVKVDELLDLLKAK